MDNNNNFDGSGAVKRRSKKRPETRKGDNKAVAGVVALLIGFVFFIVLVTVEDRIVKGEVKSTVVVALQDVPDGLVVNEKNVGTYFQLAERISDDIPAGSIVNLETLMGKTVSSEMLKNEIITHRHLVLEDYTKDIDDPVELSIELSKVGEAVAGTLRAGDIIDMMVYYEVPTLSETLGSDNVEPLMSDIPVVSPMETDTVTGESFGTTYNSEQTANNTLMGSLFADESLSGDLTYSADGRYVCEKIAESIRVTGVYNSAGEDMDMVAAAQGNMIATIVKVVVPRELEPQIGLALEQGTVRLAKVLPSKQTSAVSKALDSANAVIEFDLYKENYTALRFFRVEDSKGESSIYCESNLSSAVTEIKDINNAVTGATVGEDGSVGISYESGDISAKLVRTSGNEEYVLFTHGVHFEYSSSQNSSNVYETYTGVPLRDLATNVELSASELLSAMKDGTALENQAVADEMRHVSALISDWNEFQDDKEGYVQKDEYLLPKKYVEDAAAEIREQEEAEAKAEEEEYRSMGAVQVFTTSTIYETEVALTQEELDELATQGEVSEFGSQLKFNKENPTESGFVSGYTIKTYKLEDGTPVFTAENADGASGRFFKTEDGKMYSVVGMKQDTSMEYPIIWAVPKQ